MSGHSLVPSVPSSQLPAEPGTYAPPPGWGATPPPAPEQTGVPWARYIAALLRYKWLIAGVTVLGTLAGVGATRLIAPEYRVNATIWVNEISAADESRGPIRAGELLESIAWVELLRSYAIADSVVRELRLYVLPATPADEALFATFDHAPEFRTGSFILSVDPARRSYALGTKEQTLERGALGDSIGRSLGFRWQPPAEGLLRRREISFAVIPPREASVQMLGTLQTQMPDGSNFLRLAMTGTEPERTATTLNTLARNFVATAAAIKRRKDTELVSILQEQLSVAERELQSAEIALENFRTSTITLPSEGVPLAGGTELTRDPVLGAFFEQKTAHDGLRHDRELLAASLEDLRAGRIPPDALQTVPGVVDRSPALQSLLGTLSEQRAQLRAAQQTFTEQHPTVQALAQSVRTLETETIPRQAEQLLADMTRREREMARRIEISSGELRQIPARTIEEMRLRRQVAVATTLYNTLKSRYEEAKLAEASAAPDVTVLDSAVAPLLPTTNTAPRIILMAVVGSIGLAIALAILLDLVDRRFRYATQATHELGLSIVGAIPRLRRGRNGALHLESATMALEAFRSVRFSVRYAFPRGEPVMLAVTSPSPGDGKSLVASNLALSFAESGVRTLLIDGDIRRGELHATFGVDHGPGLTEVLRGEATLEDVVRPTGTPHLDIMPCGYTRHRAPELLASEGMAELLRRTRETYAVVIVDTAPLGAGVDPFALGAATGNMLLVLRTGVTDRKLAESKLKIVDRLPIRMLGTVVNDVPADDVEYKYYPYGYQYATPEERERAPRQLAVRNGR